MKDTEIEVKLAIRSRDPAGVMEAVARLDGVVGFRFLPLSTVHIRDSYLELPGGGVAAGGGRLADGGRLALRRREVDGRALLTLKGEGTTAVTGVVQRLEIEVPEDETGWGRIRKSLAEAGVGVGEGLTGLHALRPFQLRETVRVRRAVWLEDGREKLGESAQPLAELTLDTVGLEVAGRRIRFCEVEVEARTGVQDPARLVEGIATALRNAIGSDLLQPWSLSKLATGIALEDLAEAGELDVLLGENGDLLPAGLDGIEGRSELTRDRSR